MSITFKDLENFVICAESKTLSEAADRLNMAQPSLSLAIKKLEEELGTALFFRSREGIKLTPRGKLLLPEALETLNSLNRLKGHKTIRKFKIGCHPSVGMFVLGDFLKIMYEKSPEIDFEILNHSSHDTNKLVASGDIDFGIIMNPVHFQGLIEKKIGEDEVCLWESTDRYQEKIIYNPNLMQSLSILSRLKNSNDQKIEVDNLELLAHLVASGAGIGIIPSQVVKSQRLKLKKIPNTPSFKDELHLVCYPEMLKSKEGKIVFEALKLSYKN